MRFDKNKLSLTMKLTRDLTAVRVIAFLHLPQAPCLRKCSLAKELAPNLSLVMGLARSSCHCYGTCSRFLSVVLVTREQLVMARRAESTARQSTYHTLLVMARRVEYTAWQSHRPQLVRELAHESCSRFLSLAMERSDRSNLLASNTCFFGLLRYARNDKSQDGHTAFAMTTRTALGHANSHKCGWRDARL